MLLKYFILKTTKESNNIKVYADSTSNQIVATIKGGGESYTIYDTPLGSHRYKINILDGTSEVIKNNIKFIINNKTYIDTKDVFVKDNN